MGINSRAVIIDLLRGLAVVMMIVFHFCYDLTYFKLISIDFYHDPFWLNFRTLIVTLFLVIVGVSLYLVKLHISAKQKIIRRLIILFLCALIITIVSYFLFPGRTIVIGIIHFITLASIFSLPMIRIPRVSLLSGIALIFIGTNITHTIFNQPALHWIGLMTYRPATEDYVPLLPWLGVVWVGIGIGWLLNETRIGNRFLSIKVTIPGYKIVEWLGKNSLAVYMLHQPILFGLLWLTLQIINTLA